ncbi:MAG: hypothetical protein HC797_00295, partial [Anaerolineales bacterium]|nr:hypothetical protein [Anaerolineales bacterium]
MELVQPVTAESIRANLSRDDGSTSKARGTVNWHIGFTILTLILLLIFQIYWVIGNQLTTQAIELSQKEAELSLALSENQHEYSQLEILYKQTETNSENFSGLYNFYYTPEWERDTLDNIIERADLEKQLELLKSQLERSSALLSVWSGPWKGVIEEQPVCVEGENVDDPSDCVELELLFNEDYASQFVYIDSQIQAIESQIAEDPTGLNEAQNQILYYSTQAASLRAQLDGLNGQYSTLDSEARILQEKLTSFDQRTILEELLVALTTNQTDVQNQIEALRSQLNNLPADADATTRSDLESQINNLATDLANIQVDITDANNQLSALSNVANENRSQLESELNRVIEERASILDQIQYIESQMQFFLVDPEELAKQIVVDRELAKSQWENERKIWERREQADAERERARREQFQNQLAGQFVLVVLQSYLLPLLYGILGAATSVLRTLSGQIEKVTFSESAGIQHVLRISLGALAGIMVGWFSFLWSSETTTFLGSVSPLAIAFLVGYNIELFFSLMDVALTRVTEASRKNPPNTGMPPAPPQPLIQPTESVETIDSQAETPPVDNLEDLESIDIQTGEPLNKPE